jgi:hypothetical protein
MKLSRFPNFFDGESEKSEGSDTDGGNGNGSEGEDEEVGIRKRKKSEKIDSDGDDEIPSIPKKRSRRRISSGQSSESVENKISTDSDSRQEQPKQMSGSNLLASLAIQKLKAGIANSSMFCFFVAARNILSKN